LANRIRSSSMGTADSQTLTKAAYRLAYSREPSDEELSRAAGFLESQTHTIAASPSKVSANSGAIPNRSGTAAVFHPGSGQTRLQVPDNPLMPQYDFTIEAYVLLRSVDNGAGLRTILSRWNGRPDQPGWSFGVAGKSASLPPGTLMLELIGDTTEDGTGGYEAISSGIRLDIDTPYYVAVSLRIGDKSETGLVFYVKELTAGAPIRPAHVTHKVTANHQSNLPVLIGGDAEQHRGWDGMIDDVRLSSRALKADELLVSREGVNESTVGFWRFEEPDFYKDSSPNGHDIRSEISPSAKLDPNSAALIDMCHVLFNSSEFLYVQ